METQTQTNKEKETTAPAQQGNINKVAVITEKKDYNTIAQAPIKDSIAHSISPSIAEIERFILFLNKRFGLGLPNNISISIEKTSPTYKGFFRPHLNPEHITNEQTALNQIVLSSYHLKNSPYETIAHETAHFINYFQGVKDCSNSQYHNKHFKTTAEKLLLLVEKTKKGYSLTKDSPAFIEMLKEFSPSPTAFKIFQNIRESKIKKPNRNLLYICSCGVKIRTARNENKPLKAICSYCNTEFINQDTENSPALKCCCYNNKNKGVLKWK